MNTYSKQPHILSKMDIDKELQRRGEAKPTEIGGMTPEMLYGAELPFYFLYKDGADAEGAKGIPARLLDMVLNSDDPTKPYMTGDIAVKLALTDYFSVISNVDVCVIQVETPNDEMHAAIVLRSELEKIYTIIHETNQAGKEVTIKFHTNPPIDTDGVKNNHVAP